MAREDGRRALTKAELTLEHIRQLRAADADGSGARSAARSAHGPTGRIVHLTRELICNMAHEQDDWQELICRLIGEDEGADR